MAKASITADELSTKLLDKSHSDRREYSNLTVHGPLNLSQADVPYPVMFRDCDFYGQVILSEATFTQLGLVNCRIGQNQHNSDLLEAPRLNITKGNLDLTGLQGTVNLAGAHLRDDLNLQESKLSRSRDEGYSLKAPNLRIGGNILCSPLVSGEAIQDHSRVQAFECSGSMILSDARIQGSVYFEGATIGDKEDEPKHAFYGDGMTIEGTFYGDRITVNGQLRLVGVTIGGSCELHGAVIRRSSAKAAPREGAVMMDRLTVGGSLFCANGFECHGTFRAVGCHINATARFSGATLTASEETDHVALAFDRSVIGGRLCLDKTSDASGGQDPLFRTEGKISLMAAEVGREVWLDVSAIKSSIDDIELQVAADLTRLQTTILFILGNRDEANPKGRGFIDYTQAKVGVLWDQDTTWSEHGEVLKGLRYDAIHSVDVALEKRLGWVSKGAKYARSVYENDPLQPRYVEGIPSPQPYDQLAAAYQVAGKDSEAHSVLLRKHQDIKGFKKKGQNLIGGVVQAATRTWNFLQDFFIGYGYRPARAVFALLGLWIVGVIVFYIEPPQSTSKDGPGINGVEHFTYPADLLIPLIGFGQKARWQPSETWTSCVGMVLTLMGWILGATVIAAMTRAVSRR